MGGLFGVASKKDCVFDVYFGTDYHSHLGTSKGGMAILEGNTIHRAIHNISTTQFRAKFESELDNFKGNMGIGCISDAEAQPLTVRSHLGQYSITTVGKINNVDEIIETAFENRMVHFMETSRGVVNPTELVSAVIDTETSFVAGLLKAQELIQGSCTILILTSHGLYASRDKYGRTPLIIGKKEDTHCVTFESCVFANLGYSFEYELGPGEIVLVNADGYEQLAPARKEKKICSFLWVYYGYPSSTYEGESVELMRYRNGAAMAKHDTEEIDVVAGVPDSGVGHAIGYSNESKIPFGRPFIKYTPTWSRSFMPQNQEVRNLVARMKLMPIPELVENQRLLLCDDSIVRGTQLRETVELLYGSKAKEVHIRSACPPLVFGCKFLNFSTSRSEMDLVARQVIIDIEGKIPESLSEYCDPNSEKYAQMLDGIRKRLNLSTLKYQNIHDMVDAIGIGEENLCTYCWTGKE